MKAAVINEDDYSSSSIKRSSRLRNIRIQNTTKPLNLLSKVNINLLGDESPSKYDINNNNSNISEDDSISSSASNQTSSFGSIDSPVSINNHQSTQYNNAFHQSIPEKASFFPKTSKNVSIDSSSPKDVDIARCLTSLKTSSCYQDKEREVASILHTFASSPSTIPTQTQQI